jgi:predicted ATPase
MHQRNCYVIRRKITLGLDRFRVQPSVLLMEGRPCATGGEAKRKISRETAQEQGANQETYYGGHRYDFPENEEQAGIKRVRDAEVRDAEV